MSNLRIPVGVSDFEQIRKNGYYYIDKSGHDRRDHTDGTCGCDSDHPAAPVWKDAGHEYAGKFF